MCGITGVYKIDQPVCSHTLSHMTQAINHRGPDAQSIWVNDNIGLGHSRLAIHDLSQAGSQPMTSCSGLYTIVFNGEIYNYQALRSELRNAFGVNFESDTDTEVLINAIELWGISKALQEARGMFAFACWSCQEQTVYLARDRFGEKPLYYGFLGQDFVFSSELKCFKEFDASRLNIDQNVLATYLRFSYVPTPYSIYKQIYKLEPGSYLTVDANLNTQLQKYWHIESCLDYRRTFTGRYDDAINATEKQLKNTLALQMESDVPLGAFLSGGIDSSVLVALMQSMSSRKIQTFSIGFYETKYNEAEHAAAVANYLGTEHTNMYVTEQEALSIIPELPQLYDEPFADSSQVPTYLVSKLARSSVTVSLSGDGGDELFGGYERYFLAEKIRRRIISKALVRLGITGLPQSLLNLLYKMLPANFHMLAAKLVKLQNVLKHGDKARFHLYKHLSSQIHFPEALVLEGNELRTKQDDYALSSSLTFQEWMMFKDLHTNMMDGILTKVDRAAMATSLETRAPFLDHHVFELAWSLPKYYKIGEQSGKYVLKDLLCRYVPRSLIERPKKGFGIPLEKWLRGDLKEWAEELLDPVKIRQQGYFNVEEIQKYWREHQSGRRDWQLALWNILMFQAWLERND